MCGGVVGGQRLLAAAGFLAGPRFCGAPWPSRPEGWLAANNGWPHLLQRSENAPEGIIARSRNPSRLHGLLHGAARLVNMRAIRKSAARRPRVELVKTPAHFFRPRLPEPEFADPRSVDHHCALGQGMQR